MARFPENFAVGCVVFDGLGDCPVSKENSTVGGVFGGGFKFCRHLFLPAFVDPSGGAGAGLFSTGHRILADPFVEARLRENCDCFTEQILHHVGKVHTHIEKHAAGVLLVAPDGDEHSIGSAKGVVNHQAGLSDDVGLE